MFVVRTPSGFYFYQYVDENQRTQYGLHSDKSQATQYSFAEANSLALSRPTFLAFVEAV